MSQVVSILAFPPRAASGDWRPDELAALAHLLPADGANHWDVGTTEAGDPQFYLLGPAPDFECVLCVSRLAHGYVMQDGAGRIVGEAPSLQQFAEEAARAAMRGSRSFIARVTLLVAAVRLTIEEKVEPIFEETQELLVRVAPQLAAFV